MNKKPTFERFSTFEELKGIKKPNQEDTKVVSLNNGTAEVSDLYINGELHVPMKFVESYSGMEREKIIKQYNKWKVNQKLVFDWFWSEIESRDNRIKELEDKIEDMNDYAREANERRDI